MAKDLKFFGQKYTLEAPKVSSKSKVFRVPMVKLPDVLLDLNDIIGAGAAVAQNNMALQVLAEVQREGFLQNPYLLIGGRPATSVFTAKLGENIKWIEGDTTTGEDGSEQQSAFFNEILMEAQRVAQSAAPRDTGLFMRNFVWLDSSGGVLGSVAPQQKAWTNGETVYLVNRAPYSRKIEEMKKAPRTGSNERRVKADTKKGFSRYSMKAPNGVFRVVSKKIRAKFKSYIQARMVLVRKQYVKLPSTLYGIQTSLKDGRYPAVRFVYRGGSGYRTSQRALAVAEAKKLVKSVL